MLRELVSMFPRLHLAIIYHLTAKTPSLVSRAQGVRQYVSLGSTFDFTCVEVCQLLRELVSMFPRLQESSPVCPILTTFDTTGGAG